MGDTDPKGTCYSIGMGNMGKGNKLADSTTLRMALVGYQIEKQKIDEKIAELQRALKGSSPAPAATGTAKTPEKRTRILSAAARARIAAAQRKRWAEHRKRVAAAKKAAPKPE
jgi:hypothetical protein